MYLFWSAKDVSLKSTLFNPTILKNNTQFENEKLIFFQRYNLEKLDDLDDIELDETWLPVLSGMKVLQCEKFTQAEITRLNGMKHSNLEKLGNLCKLVLDRKETERKAASVSGQDAIVVQDEPEVDFRCKSCDMVMKTARAKILHEKYKLCSKQCPNCFKIFTRTADLIRHLSHHGLCTADKAQSEQSPIAVVSPEIPEEPVDHTPEDTLPLLEQLPGIEQTNDKDSAEADQPSEEEETGEQADCETCNRLKRHGLKHKYALKNHVDSVHRGIRYQCPQCQISFSQHLNCRKHLNVFHDISYSASRDMPVKMTEVAIENEAVKKRKRTGLLSEIVILTDTAEVVTHDLSAIEQDPPQPGKRARKQRKSAIIASAALAAPSKGDYEDVVMPLDTDPVKVEPESVTGRDSLVCEYCHKSFRRSRDKSDHIDAVHHKIQFECPLCNDLLSCVKSVRRHMKLCHDVSKEASEEFTLRRVIDRRTKTLSAKYKLDRASTKCEFCQKVFVQPSGKVEHVNSVHKKIRHQCPQCDKTFSVKRAVLTHLDKGHNIPIQRSSKMTIRTIVQQPDVKIEFDEAAIL